jgi:hypothetical protein
MPCPNTVQGLTPIPAEINKASPSPNKTSPIIKNITEINFGFKVRALGELQNNIGTALAERIFNLNIIQQHKKNTTHKELLTKFALFCTKSNVFFL